MPFKYIQLDPDNVPLEIRVGLFMSWVARLSRTLLNLDQHGSGGGSDGGRQFTFGSPTGNHFVLAQANNTVTLLSATGINEEDIQRIAEEAQLKTTHQDFGEGLVYRVVLTVEPLDYLQYGVQFMRTLGDQQHIEGSRRLGDRVLLDFAEGKLTDAPTAGLLFAPPTEVIATLFVPGPEPTDLARDTAGAITEMTAAVVALAVGRPVKFSGPMFPVKADAATAALARRRDPSILGLARDTVSVDVFNQLPALGGIDAILRIRGSLLAYHAALQQLSPDVAVMLFVTAIEALIAPRQEWGKEKVTQRFIRMLIDLCPDAVDQLLAHGNVKEAFGFKPRGGPNRQRKELLDAIYQSRSTPTHMGLNISDNTIMATMGNAGSMRVAHSFPTLHELQFWPSFKRLALRWSGIQP